MLGVCVGEGVPGSAEEACGFEDERAGASHRMSSRTCEIFGSCEV